MIFLRLASLLTPTTKTNWINTILKTTNINKFKHLLTDKELEKFKSLGKEDFYFWADIQPTIDKSNKVREGLPIVWLGRTEEGGYTRFHAKAKIELALENEKLGNFLWVQAEKKKKNQYTGEVKIEYFPYKYVYTLKELDTHIDIPLNISEFKKKNGADSSEGRAILSAHVLRDFAKFDNNFVNHPLLNINDEQIKIRTFNWYDNVDLRKIDKGIKEDFSNLESDGFNRRGQDRNAHVAKAWIYEISFELDGKKIKYVGQENVSKNDIFENSQYKSSSLVFWHIRKTLGLLDASADQLKEKLNYKKVKLDELVNMTKGDVNDKENEFIEKMYKESKEKDFMPINYTGSNSPKYK